MKDSEKKFCRGLLGVFQQCFILILLSVLSVTASAQNKSVSGTVVDSNGEPIIGASILVKNTTNGTITDIDGKFNLGNVPANATLVVSYVGYVGQNVPVSGKTAFKITLKEDTKTLDEVVVIGYGSVKKSTLTSAVSKMDSKSLESRPLARAETALQGKLAGVTVRTTTGEPGATAQIRVRGAASVNANSDPLYVVDGVPLSDLSTLNPSDIESIEVLKDAASSAIYGSRGSNGVVIVTTKRGKSGKPKITFDASYGYQSLEKKIDLLSATEWMEFRTKWIDANYLAAAKSKGISNASIADANDVRLKNLKVASGTASSYNYIFDERWFNYVSDNVKAGHTYTPNSESLSLLDWQDKFYRTAAIQNYNMNVNGGTENTSYLFSGGYMKQEGIATGTDYERIAFRTNIESKINKYVTAGIQLAPTYIRTNGSGRVNGKDSSSHSVLTSTPVSEPGVGYMTNVQPNVKYNWAGSASSPIYIMNTNVRRDEIVNVFGNAYIRLFPFKGMKMELSGSVNYYDLDGSTYTFSSTSSSWASGEGANSSGGHNTSRNWKTLLQALINYDRTFGKHGISAMLGASSERDSEGFTTNQTFNKPFPNDAINYSFNGANVAVGTDIVTQSTPDKLLSVFGRLQYDYDNRYIISGSVRYDGGSVFGTDNKWGFFPALSGAWNVSNEKFYKNLHWDWLNTLKLRASYGVTGNNSIGNSAAYPTLSAITYGGAAGYYASSLGNADLGWEKTYSTDLAIDLGFLRNRIQLSFDWYTKNTKDLLYQVPSLGASGFTTIWENLGEIHNEGFDVELNTRNLTGSFKWDTAFNVSYNKNKVISLGADDTPVYAGFASNNPSNVLMVGMPINEFYMYDAVGVWKTQQEIDDFKAAHNGQAVTFEGKQIKPGDIRYRDVNDDGIFDKTNDRDYLGSPTPKFTYGMTNNFSYKNFDLSILLTAQTGGKIFGAFGRANDRPGMGSSSNVLGRWRNAWWSETEQGDGKTPYILSSTTGTTLDSRWLYSSDYLRVKNVTLGYKLPINPKVISYARVYLSVENLIKWDKYYGGYSPESANSGQSDAPGGSTALGIDYSGYPIARIFTMGVSVTF